MTSAAQEHATAGRTDGRAGRSITDVAAQRTRTRSDGRGTGNNRRPAVAVARPAVAVARQASAVGRPPVSVGRPGGPSASSSGRRWRAERAGGAAGCRVRLVSWRSGAGRRCR